MDIPYYISELLDDQDYAVIPGLGALLASYRPAGFTKDKSFLLPPSRSIAFYPEMKSNDGVLAGIIAHDQKIPLSQASRLLEKFTSDLLFRIEKGEKAPLGTLGHLSLEAGEIRFTPEGDSLQIPEAYGLTPVAVKKSGNQAGFNEPLREQTIKRRKNARALAGLFLLLAIVAVVVWVIIPSGKHRESVVSQVPAYDSQPAKETVITMVAESINQPKATVQPEKSSPDTTVVLHGHPRKELFYTIGGSFLSEQNAHKYTGKMKARGFHPIPLGKVGNYYLVALDTFFTAGEAFKAADQYAPVHRTTEIWVYHQK